MYRPTTARRGGWVGRLGAGTGASMGGGVAVGCAGEWLPAWPGPSLVVSLVGAWQPARRAGCWSADHDAEVEGVVASFGHFGVVGGDHEGSAGGGYVEDPREYDGAGCGVEFCGGFVGDQQPGP